MRGPAPCRLRDYARRCLGLGSYLDDPGDGRRFPQIPAATLVWCLLLARVLRIHSYHGTERLVRLAGPRALGARRRFGDDTLAYFTERLEAGPTRLALAGLLRRAKRNKVFQRSVRIGLALDGTASGTRRKAPCRLCHPVENGRGEVVAWRHKLTAISVVGTGIVLPFDVEPYGAGDSELAAGKRLLERAVARLGRRFADYVVADSLYAGAPFVHQAQDLGLDVVIRLKNNLPELYEAAKARFRSSPPTLVFEQDGARIELWDAQDFEPWGGLRWTDVRVLRYRQFCRDGKVVEAYWFTSFSQRRVGCRALYGLCKNRWQIENQVFNDAKNRYGLQHTPHHHPQSLLLHWLLTCLALSIERLYRLRYLHRGTHPPTSAADLLMRLWLSLTTPDPYDTS